MESETIKQGLQRYSIGQKIRRLRLRKSMGLSELSKHTGLSPSLLSKLERDLMHPTLPTLLRIALVFSVGLEYFFNPEPKPVLEVIRRQERLPSRRPRINAIPLTTSRALIFVLRTERRTLIMPSSSQPSHRVCGCTSMKALSFSTSRPVNSRYNLPKTNVN